MSFLSHTALFAFGGFLAFRYREEISEALDLAEDILDQFKRGR